MSDNKKRGQIYSRNSETKNYSDDTPSFTDEDLNELIKYVGAKGQPIKYDQVSKGDILIVIANPGGSPVTTEAKVTDIIGPKLTIWWGGGHFPIMQDDILALIRLEDGKKEIETEHILAGLKKINKNFSSDTELTEEQTSRTLEDLLSSIKSEVTANPEDAKYKMFAGSLESLMRRYPDSKTVGDIIAGLEKDHDETEEKKFKMFLGSFKHVAKTFSISNVEGDVILVQKVATQMLYNLMRINYAQGRKLEDEISFGDYSIRGFNKDGKLEGSINGLQKLIVYLANTYGGDIVNEVPSFKQLKTFSKDSKEATDSKKFSANDWKRSAIANTKDAIELLQTRKKYIKGGPEKTRLEEMEVDLNDYLKECESGKCNFEQVANEAEGIYQELEAMEGGKRNVSSKRNDPDMENNGNDDEEDKNFSTPTKDNAANQADVDIALRMINEMLKNKSIPGDVRDSITDMKSDIEEMKDVEMNRASRKILDGYLGELRTVVEQVGIDTKNFSAPEGTTEKVKRYSESDLAGKSVEYREASLAINDARDILDSGKINENERTELYSVIDELENVRTFSDKGLDLSKAQKSMVGNLRSSIESMKITRK